MDTINEVIRYIDRAGREVICKGNIYYKDNGIGRIEVCSWSETIIRQKYEAPVIKQVRSWLKGAPIRTSGKLLGGLPKYVKIYPDGQHRKNLDSTIWVDNFFRQVDRAQKSGLSGVLAFQAKLKFEDDHAWEKKYLGA